MPGPFPGKSTFGENLSVELFPNFTCSGRSKAACLVHLIIILQVCSYFTAMAEVSAVQIAMGAEGFVYSVVERIVAGYGH